jgi:hypothetical protein
MEEELWEVIAFSEKGWLENPPFPCDNSGPVSGTSKLKVVIQ